MCVEWGGGGEGGNICFFLLTQGQESSGLTQMFEGSGIRGGSGLRKQVVEEISYVLCQIRLGAQRCGRPPDSGIRR